MSEHEQPQIQKGIYRHGKSGGHYLVTGVSTDSSTQKHRVNYIPLSHPYREVSRLWDEFFEEVDEGGYKGPRFVFVPDAKF